MFDINEKNLILSYGRSASVMLAHRISNLRGTNLGFVDISRDLLDKPVQHTHLLFPQEKIIQFNKVFSLRRDPIQTILSFLFVGQFKVYHKVSDKDHNVVYQYNNQQTTNLTLKPFRINSFDGIDLLCKQYMNWHQYYSQQLTPDDYVVFYEDILQQVKNRSTNYQLVYGNKQEILLNYDEVVEYISANFSQAMLDSQCYYVNHQNNTNIYKFLSNPVS